MLFNTRPKNRGQCSGALTLTGKTSSTCGANSGCSGAVTSSELSTPTSRARPAILKQSPRLGVRSTSIILSLRLRYSRTSVPTGASVANSMMPSFSSLISSSAAEHSIPKDSSWRSFAFLILKLPGNTAPTVANATLMPTRALGAPHTT